MTPPVTPIGRRIGRYEIVSSLGHGGMGVVYRAHDPDLHRSVAIKLLAPDRTSDPDAEARFLVEARAIAALDHPNICTIHEIGRTDDGGLYLVMGHYEGSTLAQAMRAGPMPRTHALHVVRQVLAGLAAAHERGIVHRDVKPANIIVTSRGEVKLLDFGLAKLLPAARSRRPEDTALTDPGIAVGTVAYMSPEQSRGEEVDARSDIWSVGVILYELLAGRHPFAAPSQLAMLDAIARREAPPVPDADPAITRALDRALAKDPARRYASARDFLEELGESASAPDIASLATVSRPVVAPSSTFGERSIAVLPFANLSPDADTDFFSDGLTDEIIADLSRIASLRVTSRTSAMRLKGAQKDVREIGRELDVRFLLEGSVRRQGQNLRITTRLVDARSDATMWSEKYGGTMADVFDIQESISRSIVDALRLKLTSVEMDALARRPITDPAAWECYLRARQEVFRFSADALDRALEYLANAERIAGENAHVTAARGYVHWQYLNCGASSDLRHLEETRAAAERALVLDPSLPHGHRLRGFVAMTEGDQNEVVACFSKALELDPNDADSMFFLSAMLGIGGRPARAMPIAEKLLRVDPLTATHHALPGFLHAMAGDFANAPEPFRVASRMEPANTLLRLVLGHMLALAGRRDEAADVLRALERDSPDDFFGRLGAALRAALEGKVEEARARLADEMLAPAAVDPQHAWQVAACHALAGDVEGGIDWTGKAIARGCWNWPLLASLDPLLAPLRGHPRYTALLADLEPRWRAFSA